MGDGTKNVLITYTKTGRNYLISVQSWRCYLCKR